jgi:integrase
MSATLSAASIRDYSAIVKAVCASVINERGERQYPREWNEEYIDAPLIANQRQPSVSSEAIETMLAAANDPYRMLYVLLAGCGPLRAWEALGLAIEHISADFRTLSIVQKAKRGVIQPFLKTKAGTREIDLSI